MYILNFYLCFFSSQMCNVKHEERITKLNYLIFRSFYPIDNNSKLNYLPKNECSVIISVDTLKHL